MPIIPLPKNVRIFTSRLSADLGCAEISEVNYDLSRFPGGEIHIRIVGENLTGTHPPLIEKLLRDLGGEVFWADIRSSEDLIALAMLWEAWNRKDKLPSIRRVLVLPYMPYGRQDRVCADGEAFSLLTFATLINSMGFDGVVSFDPHSLVTNALIDRFLPIELVDLLPKVWVPNAEYVIAPDAGARGRAERVAAKIRVPVLQALKTRQGERVISYMPQDVPESASLLEGCPPMKAPCLVVDDICDGGGTFLALADELKRKGAGALSLLVTHGIFSKGIDSLLEDPCLVDKYETIYVINNISGLIHSKLKVLDHAG